MSSLQLLLQKKAEVLKHRKQPRRKKMQAREKFRIITIGHLNFCFRCGQTGHLSNTCPQRKTIVLADEENDSAIDDSRMVEEETELIEANDGDRISCVIQIVLIAPKEETNPQRHCLFKTKCTINGKVCDVIIDNGSNESFVAKKLVTTLNLKVETHPNPYQIGWVKMGRETLVSEICIVTLSIGSGYKDQIICDVIDMDVCHLLLGRPW
ncbi:hypothetical protein E5676_scaffold313G003430 [Cucumis melo var. makuwa]|uniref:CCHC-type domain-containing protein n=1 Tax=Cucumis melo var. makuwa TaxID=1194695 RepID=A0A5D3DSZ2_CUCMM|nr:hypothetical protein E5676_scaffold313G003430 [Cucumis melo var. makuwa]